MNNLFEPFAESPVLIGVGLFLGISLLLALLLGILIRRTGGSLKPLVFFFGFLAIIAVPQMVVHLLDAFVHARQVRQQPIEGATATPATATVTANGLQPVSWEIVFGPNADPSLITDAKNALEYVLSDALEARMSFSATGETALAARFGNAEAAAVALNVTVLSSNLPKSAGATWEAGRRAGSTGRVNGTMSSPPATNSTPGAGAQGKSLKPIGSAHSAHWRPNRPLPEWSQHRKAAPHRKQKSRLVSPRTGPP
jgi:hypothetical protein